MINKLKKSIYYHQIYIKFAVVLFISFCLIGLFTAIVFLYSSKEYQQEITQHMHRDLAKHVSKEYQLFNGEEVNLSNAKETFHNLMVLGPNFEFYLLDPQGEVLAYSTKPENVKRNKVDLTPIDQFLAADEINESVKGNDPKSIERDKVFSAMPITDESGKVNGYLYVILGSAIYDQASDLVLNSKIVRWGLWIFAAGLVFSLIATLWFTGIITRPLRRITCQVTRLYEKGFDSEAMQDESILLELENWKKNDGSDIDILYSAFRETLVRLREQYNRIITIDELRKEILSHVSHDLRSPLASLLGYLETWEINRETITPEQSSLYISTAKKSAQKISTLVEQLFELAHLDGDNIQVNNERFSIAELVQDVLQKFKIAADQKSVELLVTPQDVGIEVVGDIEKLDRVFTNLVENAIRHTNNGGTITVRLNDTGRFVAVEVSDNGIGIPEEDLPHVFDAHFKAGNSVRGNTAHGGLGLAITKKLLDLHQTQIEVQSALNKGTTFQFNLETAV